MTFTTLTSNGVERALADWLISSMRCEVASQASDNFAFDMVLATDASDPFPFGAKIIIQIGRASAAVNLVNATLPQSGSTSFSGGKIFFVGYRVDTFRTGSPDMESLQFKFAGPWEFFFERTVFQKLWWTWNGAANVADWRSQIVLGMSANSLIGVNDTVPGSNATNLMSIAQQVKEIAAYASSMATASMGSAQFQFDALTNEIDGTNYDLLIEPSDHCLIPDFIEGFSVSGKTSAQTGASAVDSRIVLRAPLDAVNDITCAEAMRKMLRWIGPVGEPCVWFDYTQTPPQLNVGTFDQLPPVSVAFPNPNPNLNPNPETQTIKIKKRDDLIPPAVSLKFRINNTVNGQTLTQVITDLATTVRGTFIEGIGPNGLLQTPTHFLASDGTFIAGGTQTTMQTNSRLPQAVTATIDMEGSQSLVATIGCVTLALGDPGTDSPSKTCFQILWPDLLSAANLALDDSSALPVTIKDESGSSVDITTYKYALATGNVAPWMTTSTGASGLAKKVTINAKVKFDQQSTQSSNTIVPNKVVQHEITWTGILTNLAPGTYSTAIPGEIVPYGLAGYIFSLCSIAQYEGTITLQETEIADLVPIGNVLNLTGGRAEWAAMKSPVQRVSYDLTSGRTTVSFGPAGHLGAKDFVERLRINRPPRQVYLIGGNLTNVAGASSQIGSYTNQDGQSKNVAIHSYTTTHTDLADSIANSASYGAPTNPVYPGITHDAVGTIEYPGGGTAGATGAPNAPLQHGAVGTGGDIATYYHLNANGVLVFEEISSGIKLMLRLADIGSDFESNDSGDNVIKIREVLDCVSGVTKFRQALVSAPYTTSLGNS